MIKVKHVQLRTTEENSYYWGVVVGDIASFKNWTPERAHNWVKDTFHIETTTTLPTTEFEKLMDSIREHCFRYWKLEILLPNKNNL